MIRRLFSFGVRRREVRYARQPLSYWYGRIERVGERGAEPRLIPEWVKGLEDALRQAGRHRTADLLGEYTTADRLLDPHHDPAPLLIPLVAPEVPKPIGFFAAGALGLLRPPTEEAVEALLGVLGEPGVRGLTCRAAAFCVFHLARQALGDDPSRAVRLFGAVAASPYHSRGLRTEAALQLGSLRAAAAPAIPALVSVLTDGQLNWRSHGIAADALAAVGPASVDALVLLLNQPNSWTTENVLYALNRIGPPAAAVPAAAAGARCALAHGTSRTRLAAAEFLWRSARDATVAPVLEAMLTAPRGYERTTAAKLLFEINRSPVALATIRRELRSPGEEVFTALFALKELGPAAREAIPDVVMLLSSPDEETRGTAARTLASLQCPESCPT